MKRTYFWAIVFLVLVGCMDVAEQPALPPLPTPVSTPAPAAVAEPEPEPVQEVRLAPSLGGTLRLSMRAPLTLNPLLNEDVTVAKILKLMYEPLVAMDDELRPIPHLASLDFAFSGASVVVTIRDGARWSDGEYITSDDLIFSIESLQNAPTEAIYSRNVENFASLERLDDWSVRIVFGTITGGAAYLFNFPIIARHSPHVSSGPFMFASENLLDMPTESITLERNFYTFRDRPFIEAVHVLITPDAETDLHAFDRGLTDIFLAEVPEWHRHHSVRPVQFAEHLAMNYEFIGFNFARPLPQVLEFRQAVAHSIDEEALVSNVFLAHALATRSPVHPASWLYEPGVPTHSYNIETARLLAAQAVAAVPLPTDDYGYPKHLTVLVNENNIEGVQIARILVAQMNAVGLLAELVRLPFEDYIWHLQNGYFDLFIGGYSLSLQPDLRFAFHSESPDNIMSYSDQELDRLLEAAAVSGTDSGFYRVMSDIQFHIARQLPVISLAFRHSAVVADRRLQGDLLPSVDNIFINVHEWFLTE